MENQIEQTDKMLLTLTQNELEKTNHFVDLLRDQVAELKLAIETKASQIKDLQESIKSKDTYIALIENDFESYGINANNLFKGQKEEIHQLLEANLGLQGIVNKEKFRSNSILAVLLKYTEYLQWYYSKQLQSLEQLTEESTKHSAALRNALHDKDYELEKANRRWTDLQTANCNMIAENRILRKKLDLAAFILKDCRISNDGNFIITCSFNTSARVEAFGKWLEFDKQPENQIDTILTSLPSYSDLEKQVAELKQQLFFSREENQRLSDKCNSLIQENSVYKLTPNVKMISDEYLVSAEIEKLKEENKELKDRLQFFAHQGNSAYETVKEQRQKIQEQRIALEQDSTRIKELKDINHTLTNTLSNVETQRDTAIRASEYHASKLKLADKILYGTGILTMSYECLKQLPKVVNVNELMKIIKEYITFEHRKEESK